jgi:hypothetical protein
MESLTQGSALHPKYSHRTRIRVRASEVRVSRICARCRDSMPGEQRRVDQGRQGRPALVLRGGVGVVTVYEEENEKPRAQLQPLGFGFVALRYSSALSSHNLPQNRENVNRGSIYSGVAIKAVTSVLFVRLVPSVRFMRLGFSMLTFASCA